MRLLVTIEAEAPERGSGAGSGPRHDIVLDYAPGTRVRDLAAVLSGAPAEAAPANVISLPGASSVPTLTGPADLYLGELVLDPSLTIDASPIRHGVVLGLGRPSSHREAEPRGVVEIRISSGPGAGRVHRLGVGRATLGPGRHCTIKVPELADEPALAGVEEVILLEVATDGTVTLVPDDATIGQEMPVPLRREPVTEPIVLQASSVHEEKRRRWLRRSKTVLEFQLGDRIDPANAVPLVHLDREPLDGPTTWEPEQCLGVGPILLDRVQVTEPDASLSASPTGPTLDYNRPPRLHPAAQPNEFSLPQEPRRPDKMPFPLVMLLSPLLMSGVSYLGFGRNPLTLLMALGMPLMMLANASGSRRQQKKRFVEQVKEYQERRVRIEEAALKSLVGERGTRRRNYPDPATVLLFATGPRARLWERRPWDRDFLHLRIGTSDLPSEVTIKDPKRDAHEGPLLWTAPDVPVTIPMREAGVVGVAGDADRCRTLAMWAVAQVAALHSPSDTMISVLLGRDPSPRWDWVKWLPHARTDEGHPRPVRLATDEDTRSSAISELMGELQTRKELPDKEIAGLTRWVVVLDGAREIRMSSGMVSLLKDGPRLGIYFICLDRTVRELPEECRTVASFEEDQLNLETNEQRHVDAVRPDLVGPLWLDRLARALAPIHDVSTEDLASALPAASRLLDVLNLHEPDAAKVARGWGGKGRTTRAVIGESTDGVFAIDIRADGPHGLVAGTTGSGKSELLQTMIASLAVGNRPDEFNFVLVDYKGGAAFKDCNHLPHTVGMVTDLDGHLTTRALESLGAELRRREHQLADADAKDIEDYTAGRQPGDEPMPRLLIVIDEFAALASELPDFVTGLVDVARRGRSLGVHLILATQRPAGVVSAEIKSNTNLRIALRVTDAGDSADVIESPDAAHIAKS
ncbi:MAG: FtsK/SpoIIIE domain-containing protein, partial [Marmoricola sp.]